MRAATRFVLGVLVGLSLAALVLGFVWKVYIESSFGEATVALGTVALASATVWLGLQTLSVSRATKHLGEVTHEELELLREQSAATKEQAATMREQLQELRESRFAEFLPMLRWQSPSCGTYREGPMISFVGNEGPRGEPVLMAIDVLCTNEGPGPARLRAIELTCDTGEAFRAEGIDIPSTMATAQRLTPLKIRAGPFQEVQPGVRVLEIRVRYSDLLGEFNYETRAVIEAAYGGSGCEARFLESDERSALERRLTEATTAQALRGKVRCSQCSESVRPGLDLVEVVVAPRGVLAAQFTCHRCGALTVANITDPQNWQVQR